MATIEAVRPHSHARTSPFHNEPATDFARGDVAREMREALRQVEGQLGREYDLVIGGRRVRTSDKITVGEPGATVADCRYPPEGRQRARRTRDGSGV